MVVQMALWRRCSIVASFGACLWLASAAAACAATVMVLSDSAGVYLIDTTSGAIVQSYGNLFSGSSAQNLAQDLSGNLYVTNSTGVLLKSTFNPNAPTSATAYSAATTVGQVTGLSAAEARLSFDPTTTYCASGCLVTMTSATTVVWIDPATAATVKSLTLSASTSTGGDIVVVPTGASSETLYIVATKTLYTSTPRPETCRAP